MREKAVRHPLIEAIGEMLYLLNRLDDAELVQLRESIDSHTTTNCCWSRYAAAQFLDPHVVKRRAKRAAATSSPAEPDNGGQG